MMLVVIIVLILIINIGTANTGSASSYDDDANIIPPLSNWMKTQASSYSSWWSMVVLS